MKKEVSLSTKRKKAWSCNQRIERGACCLLYICRSLRHARLAIRITRSRSHEKRRERRARREERESSASTYRLPSYPSTRPCLSICLCHACLAGRRHCRPSRPLHDRRSTSFLRVPSQRSKGRKSVVSGHQRERERTRRCSRPRTRRR